MEKRSAIVTGGSRGIGRAVCLALAAGGIDLVIGYAGNEAAANETAAACRALGVTAEPVRADVATEDGCKVLFDRADELFGKTEILVNNSRITRDNLIVRMSEADFDAVVDTNLRGTFLCMKLAARGMMRRRYGRIINLSSVVGLHGNAGQVNYAASKAGVIGMTKSLAKELASRGVTVNAVAPGFIDTDMTAALPEAARAELVKTIPVGSIGSTEDVAQAVVFLINAPYITGQVLSVDGGMSM